MKTVAAFALLVLGTAPALAQQLNLRGALQVPTLDEGGLVALVALVGVVGGIIAHRRRKK